MPYRHEAIGDKVPDRKISILPQLKAAYDKAIKLKKNYRKQEEIREGEKDKKRKEKLIPIRIEIANKFSKKVPKMLMKAAVSGRNEVSLELTGRKADAGEIIAQKITEDGFATTYNSYDNLLTIYWER